MSEADVKLLAPRGVLDIDSGEVIERGYVRVEGDRITAVDTDRSIGSDADQVIELPELTLLPGLLDLEFDLVLGGPGAGLTEPVVTDPVQMAVRGPVTSRRTLRHGFPTLPHLGRFVATVAPRTDLATRAA